MRITIRNPEGLLSRYTGAAPGQTVSLEVPREDLELGPGGIYAVVTWRERELMIAIRVEEESPESLAGSFVDAYSIEFDEIMLYRFRLDWRWIIFGFCKVVLWAPEKVNEFGGVFEKTVHRFYFDRELYKRRVHERHGLTLPEEE